MATSRHGASYNARETGIVFQKSWEWKVKLTVQGTKYPVRRPAPRPLDSARPRKPFDYSDLSAT
jgi:hypothetical protein